MNIPKYARYDYCAQKACEFLEEFNINAYPIDVEKIINDQQWGITPYSLLMKEFNCDRDTVIRCLRSKDGYTQLDDCNYSIAFNDDPKYGNRIRFTLMHEIGHIYLRHLEEFDITLLFRGSLTEEENQVLENEANAFARNVLAPIPVVEHLKNKTIRNVASFFGITKQAAKARFDLYDLDIFFNRQANLSERLAYIFHKVRNKKKCSLCGFFATIETYKYCPICGSKNTLQWGDGEMKYKEYEIDDHGRLKRCMICDNEELIGDFCHVCSAPSVNRCTDYLWNEEYHSCNNDSFLPANARFCPHCGSKSLFFHRNILVDWKIEKEQIEEAEQFEAFIEQEQQSQQSGFVYIPDWLEDEEPFK